MTSRPGAPGDKPDAALAPSLGRIAVISNPASHANRSGRTAFDAAAAAAGITVAEAAGPAELHTALSAFAAAGIGLIVVNGGDGTVRDVLSALPAAYPGPQAALALMLAGNTNLAARALGSPGRGAKALLRLIDAARRDRLRTRTCPILEAAWNGDPARAPVRGFLFGTAVFARAKRLADAQIHRRGIHAGLAVGLVTVTMLLQVLSSRSARTGTAIKLTIDDTTTTGGAHFLLLATTLDRLMLGLFPFWGAGAGHIRWLDVAERPPRLAAALFAGLLQRPRPWMQAAGYHSGKATRMTLHFDGPFLIDGDFFEAGPHGITLSSPASVTVVRP